MFFPDLHQLVSVSKLNEMVQVLWIILIITEILTRLPQWSNRRLISQSPECNSLFLAAPPPPLLILLVFCAATSYEPANLCVQDNKRPNWILFLWWLHIMWTHYKSFLCILKLRGHSHLTFFPCETRLVCWIALMDWIWKLDVESDLCLICTV